MAVLTLETLKDMSEVETYLLKGNAHLEAIGFTDHGVRHSNLVAKIARNILLRLDYPEREAELAAIAGYLHDLGNVVSRWMHGQMGAMMAWQLLREAGMPAHEVATVVGAIGSHDPEDISEPVNNVAAAVILADKSDVHRSRVRNPDVSQFDIHDRVNYAVQRSFVKVDEAKHTITLQLTVDTTISPVMDYFEIFLARMVMCRRAAEFLHCSFELSINDVRLL